MRMSLTPRALTPGRDRGAELGPLGLLDPEPEDLLLAVRVEGERDVDGLVLDQPLVADLDAQGVEKHHRVDRIERPVLPFPHLVQNRVGDPADQVGRDLGAVELGDVALDLANRHAAPVEAQDLVVEAAEPPLALRDQLRLEAAGPVARDLDVDLAVLGQDRLRARAVAAVAAAAARRVALLVAQMRRQLRPERTLDQRLLQPFEQPVVAGQVLRLLIVGKQLIQKLRINRRRRHVSLLQKVNSQKPAYTAFLTPSSASATTSPEPFSPRRAPT